MPGIHIPYILLINTKIDEKFNIFLKTCLNDNGFQ
jgi:hypothetical protein